MNTRALFATTAVAAFVFGASVANATSPTGLAISGSYSVAVSSTPTDTYSAPTPSISNDLGTASSPATNPPTNDFTGTTTLFNATTTSASLYTDAPNSYSSCTGANHDCTGTVTQDLVLTMDLSDGLGGTATLTADVQFSATYTGSDSGSDYLFYMDEDDGTESNETTSNCNESNNCAGEADVVSVTFSDGATADVDLYGSSDWDMTSVITFTPLTGPRAVPEPASMVLFASGLAGLGLLRRRLNRKAAKAA
jgi:hypothetical protein